MITSVSYTFIAVVTVGLLATAGDITLSWTSPIYPQIYSNDTSINPLEKPITENEDAWIGSLLTIGAIVGPIPFGFVAEYFGRKIALLGLAVPLIVSYITMAFAKNVYLFYIGRILGGMAMGSSYTLLPMYIAEISQDSNRGMLSQTLNIFWALGNFIPYALGPFVSILNFNIIAACIPTTFFLTFILIGPETPYYLLSTNNIEKAEKSLMLLRPNTKEAIEKELEHIKANLKNDDVDLKILEIFKKSELRKAFIICIVLIVAQETSGFCAIIFYLQPIFEVASTEISSHVSAIIVGFSMFVSSFFSPILIERAGRRILIIFSCFGMFLSLSMLGIFFYIQDSTSLSTTPIFWIPIFSMIFYIFSYNFGIGPVPWTLASELFPSNIKHVSSSAVSSTCWITSFLVTKFFNDMNYGMGRAGTFWFFASTSFAAAIFSIFYVPETKGKSFSEIQDILRSK